ncbi:MAG TPA: DUF4199 domain-containing protein [Mariniphaga sp.]|nr:DUF4199 domain-containing protein [Mariniphaga sp.]
MEQTSVSTWKSSLSYGLYLGIALVVIAVIFYVTGNNFSDSANWINYTIMTLGVVMAQIHFRKQLGGTMNYSQALGVGVLTMLFASVITGFFTYLLYAVIDPSLQDQMKLAMEEQIAKQNIPEEQFEMAVEMATMFKSPAVLFFMNIAGGTFIGLIISLITSIFTQRKPIEDFS